MNSGEQRKLSGLYTSIYWSQIMGYYRKHKIEIRSGFEAIMVIGITLMLSPIIIIMHANHF